MVVLQSRDIQQKLPDWTVEGNSIRKDFTLEDFQSALTFIIRIGFAAEKMDHHPDISLYSYKNVSIILSTHNEGGVTDKDLKLAEIIDSLVK